MSRQRTLVLTGASRGIGHATVKKFSAEGWRVLSCSRQPFDARCPWPGGEDNHIQVDLADPHNTMEAISVIRDKVGGCLDALVNNAGISPKGAGGARLNTLDTDLRTWGQVFHVNFFASVVLARGLKDELAAAGGAVVNVTSIAGTRVHPFAGAAYATSKAALKALTREMAHDFGPLGVRVNAIAPGEVETSILSPGTDKIVEKLPLRRLGQPSEVAEAIYFLCSERSSYISGTEIEVNGGQHV
ncbi:3-ketoacyl-(acyl-carrier-protein) reductase [Dinoroseobacter shibae DFL 12 = DSM 16493]|jgi:NAD(P)-dependent dehydrogenase (short-subunit alcohol dehydrogenase family)|uniref:3-ketoacyl-(Acyl-carrier-protein) reductase n=1 Tax=Dinoroseobacter shibae (strain DSM 16493 / NCIMB 14021 / DFL 12) TaxID=398580 RepID=A8LM97_DINSH|nr:SDR family oxidoreductase [Dinoroseobacter shibae]ABV92074.1 3-ketoacyl-(acyl-carrier-protein) reductase [Dinoroseobacter shibae DFL 12 = DSM 16493]URF47037.1 SDR family oxidoreductase [Dinoroseobacter shibae]URF51348.1 SDR family oxidoreductase [Dinoroseobacter shibae]